MTEMVYGAVPVRDGEPILPKWWRTIDKWSVSCVLILFGVGILLGLAASVPLAEKNGFDHFHYVKRQAFFGGLALTAMFLTSMMSPQLVRRFGRYWLSGRLRCPCFTACFRHGFRQRRCAVVQLGLC